MCFSIPSPAARRAPWKLIRKLLLWGHLRDIRLSLNHLGLYNSPRLLLVLSSAADSVLAGTRVDPDADCSKPGPPGRAFRPFGQLGFSCHLTHPHPFSAHDTCPLQHQTLQFLPTHLHFSFFAFEMQSFLFSCRRTVPNFPNPAQKLSSQKLFLVSPILSESPV